jgi:hypothetical protein
MAITAREYDFLAARKRLEAKPKPAADKITRVRIQACMSFLLAALAATIGPEYTACDNDPCWNVYNARRGG